MKALSLLKQSGKVIVACAVAAVGGAGAAQFGSSSSVNQVVGSCAGMKLQAASGVPFENKHEYSFKGTCQTWIQQTSGGKVESESGYQTYWAEAGEIWTGAQNTLYEKLTLTNPNGSAGSGVVESWFKCAQDPLIYKPDCVCFQHSNTTGINAFSNTAQFLKRPVLAGRTTQQEAAALSKNKSAGSPSPATAPPPAANPPSKVTSANANSPAQDSVSKQALPQTTLPPPKSASAGVGGGEFKQTSPQVPSAPQSLPLSQPAPNQPATAMKLNPAILRPSLLNIEAEDLVQPNKLQVGGGNVSVQAMSGFGSGWSGNTQLLWSGGATGAVLDLMVDIPATATYAVEIYLTRAPDYGKLQLAIDGKVSAITFDTYAPMVMAPNPGQAGKFTLETGTHKVSFMIIGKHTQSKGYLIGIDRMRFYPISQ